MLLPFYIHAISWLEQHQLPCLFRAAFHVDCPGCGFQRSSIALLKGDIGQSLAYYPALIPMLLFFVFLLADRKFQFRSSEIIRKTGIAAIFIIILVFYISKLTNQNNLL